MAEAFIIYFDRLRNAVKKKEKKKKIGPKLFSFRDWRGSSLFDQFLLKKQTKNI